MAVLFLILFDTIKSFHTAWFLCFWFFFFFFFLSLNTVDKIRNSKNLIFCNNRVLISTMAIPYVFQYFLWVLPINVLFRSMKRRIICFLKVLLLGFFVLSKWHSIDNYRLFLIILLICGNDI